MRFLIGLVRGFFVFWYDFIVGDCWELAAGVAVVLVASVLLIRSQAIPELFLPFIVAGAIMLLLVLSGLLELRRKTAAGKP